MSSRISTKEEVPLEGLPESGSGAKRATVIRGEAVRRTAIVAVVRSIPCRPASRAQRLINPRHAAITHRARWCDPTHYANGNQIRDSVAGTHGDPSSHDSAWQQFKCST
jgi:hypothetical protein